MRVTLAYTQEINGKSHNAGNTVNVDQATAKRLLRDGAAREAAAPQTPAAKGEDKTAASPASSKEN